MRVKNPFRNAEMRRLFDGYVAMFYDGKLRNPNGTPSHGGSTRCMFWRGYDGIPQHMGLALTGHGTIGYAAFRAGKAVKKAEDQRILRQFKHRNTGGHSPPKETT